MINGLIVPIMLFAKQNMQNRVTLKWQTLFRHQFNVTQQPVSLSIMTQSTCEEYKDDYTQKSAILPPLQNRTQKTTPGGMGASASQAQDTLY